MSEDPKVVQLHKPFAPDDMVDGLRKLADQIEAGEYGLRTTCLVVLGHTADKPGESSKEEEVEYDVFGYGPRCDTFTTRGLLLTAATKF